MQVSVFGQSHFVAPEERLWCKVVRKVTILRIFFLRRVYFFWFLVFCAASSDPSFIALNRIRHRKYGNFHFSEGVFWKLMIASVNIAIFWKPPSGKWKFPYFRCRILFRAIKLGSFGAAQKTRNQKKFTRQRKKILSLVTWPQMSVKGFPLRNGQIRGVANSFLVIPQVKFDKIHESHGWVV